MKITNQAQVDDVITSPNFKYLIMCRDEYGNLVYKKDQIEDAKKLNLWMVNYSKWNTDKEMSYHIVDGVNIVQQIDPATIFVVTKAKWGGGGTGMGKYDVYPDAWQVEAIERNNPDGMRIRFNQKTNCYSYTVDEVIVTI